jgi:hypothetical protein
MGRDWASARGSLRVFQTIRDSGQPWPEMLTAGAGVNQTVTSWGMPSVSWAVKGAKLGSEAAVEVTVRPVSAGVQTTFWKRTGPASG